MTESVKWSQKVRQRYRATPSTLRTEPPLEEGPWTQWCCLWPSGIKWQWEIQKECCQEGSRVSWCAAAKASYLSGRSPPACPWKAADTPSGTPCTPTSSVARLLQREVEKRLNQEELLAEILLGHSVMFSIVHIPYQSQSNQTPWGKIAHSVPLFQSRDMCNI